MNNAVKTDPWCIIEDGFQPQNQPASEITFALGNGKIGQRGNLEEFYSGGMQLGTYMSGIFTRKPSEPEVFSNLPDWTSMKVRLNAELVDLSTCEVKSFRRVLNMQQGFLERSFEVVTADGHHIEVAVQMFLSLAKQEIGVIKYNVRSINFAGHISFTPVIDGDFNVRYNPDAEPEWNVLQSRTQREVAHLWIQTRRTNFQVCEAISYDLFKNNAQIKTNPTKIEKQKVAGFSFGTDLKSGDSVCVYKFVAMLNSLNHNYKELTVRACTKALLAKSIGWNELFDENSQAWMQKWEDLKPEVIREEFVKMQPFIG
jgi:maltose phosphorylase